MASVIGHVLSWLGRFLHGQLKAIFQQSSYWLDSDTSLTQHNTPWLAIPCSESLTIFLLLFCLFKYIHTLLIFHESNNLTQIVQLCHWPYGEPRGPQQTQSKTITKLGTLNCNSLQLKVLDSWYPAFFWTKVKYEPSKIKPLLPIRKFITTLSNNSQ